MTTKCKPAEPVAPPMDEVDYWLMAQDAKALKTYLGHPEVFEGEDVPLAWVRALAAQTAERAAAGTREKETAA